MVPAGGHCGDRAGIVGVVVKGLIYLLIIGVVVLVADLTFLAVRFRRTGGSPGASSPAPEYVTIGLPWGLNNVVLHRLLQQDRADLAMSWWALPAPH